MGLHPEQKSLAWQIAGFRRKKTKISTKSQERMRQARKFFEKGRPGIALGRMEGRAAQYVKRRFRERGKKKGRHRAQGPSTPGGIARKVGNDGRRVANRLKWGSYWKKGRNDFSPEKKAVPSISNTFAL